MILISKKAVYNVIKIHIHTYIQKDIKTHMHMYLSKH